MWKIILKIYPNKNITIKNSLNSHFLETLPLGNKFLIFLIKIKLYRKKNIPPTDAIKFKLKIKSYAITNLHQSNVLI